MTTWHCDKCSLRFGTYADFGDPCNDCERSGALGPLVQEMVSATDNYTPTTEQVRRSYWYNTSDSYSAALSDAEFDRWLAAERAKAWDEGRESLAADIASPLLDNMTKRQTKNPYREVQ